MDWNTLGAILRKSLYLKKLFPVCSSNWLKPCCGRRVALWQVCLLSAGFNCILVACVILVVLFLSLELLIDTRLLQCKRPLCSTKPTKYLVPSSPAALPLCPSNSFQRFPVCQRHPLDQPHHTVTLLFRGKICTHCAG